MPRRLAGAMARLADDPALATALRRARAGAGRGTVHVGRGGGADGSALRASRARASARMLNDITPLILTFNEAPNIERTLGQLAWARDVVIVDSMSTDRTRELATARHPGVRWFERPFTTHAEQWNFGLEETSISTEWVLALDADFVLSDALVEELKQLRPETASADTGVVHLLHRRPAAARRRLSAGRRAVSPRSRQLRAGRPHAARARRRRRAADSTDHDLSRRSQAARRTGWRRSRDT